MKTNEMKKDLTILLNYLWRDEVRHYEEGMAKDHIFLVMKRLARAVDYRPVV